jgi:hypothetical protein
MYQSTNWPALRVESSTNNVMLGVRKGTNTSEFAGITAAEIISSKTNLAATITPTIYLTNGTAAANGAQQNSPALMLGGAGYNTTGSTSAGVDGVYTFRCRGRRRQPD